MLLTLSHMLESPGELLKLLMLHSVPLKSEPLPCRWDSVAEVMVRTRFEKYVTERIHLIID